PREYFDKWSRADESVAVLGFVSDSMCPQYTVVCFHLLSLMEIIPKILCVSANPGVDRRITLPSLRLGEVNRASSADPMAGGKAAHVAFAAKTLGAEVRWLAFLGGPEGESCREGIAARGIVPIPVSIQAR